LSGYDAADIELSLGKHYKKLQFPEALEAAYHQRRRENRVRLGRKSLPRTVILYNLFLIDDYLLLPHTFMIALFLHAVIITPAIIFETALISSKASLARHEITIIFTSFLVVLQILFIGALNNNTAGAQYDYFSIAVPVYLNISLRTNHRYARLSSIVMSASIAGAFLLNNQSFAAKLAAVSFAAALIYMSLFANYELERAHRYQFLRRLLDQIQIDEARERSRHDPLTGLANRLLLQEQVKRLWREAAGIAVAAVMLDVDHFKLFNDRYGHAQGDLCLQRVAGAIASSLRREDDLAVRYGGEEFFVLLPGRDLEAAVQIAERIRRAIEALAIPHEASRASPVVTASIGAFAGIIGTVSFAELVEQADAALYAVKQSGRNRVGTLP